MERLTKNLHPIHVLTEEMEKECITDKIKKLTDKLGKLEDLEEEIRCPLEVVFRALKDGFYVDKEQVEKEPAWENNKGFTQIGCPKYFKLNLWYKTIEVDREGHYLEIELSDYKKTWWLKADQSE